MIRNRHGLGLIGVDCRQRDVLCDGNLIARVDELVVFRFPSAEVFAVYRSKDTRTAAREVFLLVFGRFIRTFFFVCYGIAFTGRSKERIKCYRTVQRCVQIEQHTAFAGYNEPCGRCFAGFFLNTCNDRVKFFGLGDFLTIRNRECFRLAIRRSTQINCCVDLRRLPLCVERNALCRHRLAGEHERVAFAKLVIIPASKREVCGYTGRSCRGVRHIGNILLILAAFGFFRFAAVNERDVIRVTGVVELCTMIIITNTRTYLFIKSKACNCILVFFCNAQPSIIIRSIFVIQFITCTANIFRTSFTLNHFYIIGSCLLLCTIRRSVLIELCSPHWHCINICLIWTSGWINSPSAASLISRPLCGNIRASFSGNGLIC